MESCYNLLFTFVNSQHSLANFYLEIGQLAVDFDYRHRGYGNALIKFAIAYIEYHSKIPLVTSVHPIDDSSSEKLQTISWYKSLGFTLQNQHTMEIRGMPWLQVPKYAENNKLKKPMYLSIFTKTPSNKT